MRSSLSSSRTLRSFPPTAACLSTTRLSCVCSGLASRSWTRIVSRSIVLACTSAATPASATWPLSAARTASTSASSLRCSLSGASAAVSMGTTVSAAAPPWAAPISRRLSATSISTNDFLGCWAIPAGFAPPPGFCHFLQDEPDHGRPPQRMHLLRHAWLLNQQELHDHAQEDDWPSDPLLGSLPAGRGCRQLLAPHRFARATFCRLQTPCTLR